VVVEKPVHRMARAMALLTILSISSGTLPAQQEAGDEKGAAEILEAYIAALGGRELFDADKTVERQTEVQVFGFVNRNYRVVDLATGRFYQRSDGPQGGVETGFDGKRVWRKAAFFRGYLPETDPASRRALHREPELYQYKTSGRRYYRLPNEKVDGEELLVVESTTADPSGNQVPVKYYFDPATKLLRRSVTGRDITLTNTFRDYRKVEGHMVAFTTEVRAPNSNSTITLKSIHYNVPVEPARFEYPEGSGKKPEAPGPAEVSAGPTSTAARVPAKSLGPEDVLDEKLRLESFELVWKTIDDTYWDRAFGGVNWAAIHDKYAPQVKATARNEAFHRLLNQMVGELDRSHFFVLPPAESLGLQTRAEDVQDGAIGVELRWVKGQLLVVDVMKGYPAEEAGIRKGDVLTKINDRTPDQILKDFRDKTPGFHLREEVSQVRAAQRELAGKPDTTVAVEILDEQDQVRRKELVRRAVPLDLNALEFESRRLDGNIGYIRFNLFLGDAVAKFENAVFELHDTKGLIIDLRGNPGGVGQMAPIMANRLSTTGGSLGTLQFRYQAQRYAYEGAGSEAYTSPVVVLMDSLSASTAEVFAGGLQDAQRVTVIGITSAGAVLPATRTTLPTGAILQHAISDFHTSKGTVLEGRGVIPDIVANISRVALLVGHDPVLERASAFLRAAGDR
jgi:carboxyl-terminal processing protease